MNYYQIGEKVKKLYDQAYARRYREHEELIFNDQDYKHICNILKNVCDSFSHKISVLDLGCGSGRFFHCLQNVEKLTGIDVSPYMIKEAKNPVLKDKIQADYINLICGNVFEVNIAPFSLDFIYSIGVLGEHSPLDLNICNKLFAWLKPGGKLFFTVVDIFSKSKSLKRKIAEFLYPLLPSIWKKKLSKRWECFYMTNRELEEVMKNSKFCQYKISRYVSNSSLWKGAHYECIAKKDAQRPSHQRFQR